MRLILVPAGKLEILDGCGKFVILACGETTHTLSLKMNLTFFSVHMFGKTNLKKFDTCQNSAKLINIETFHNLKKKSNKPFFFYVMLCFQLIHLTNGWF